MKDIFFRKEILKRPGPLKKHYDVVIVGGGSHGLATAYYLAIHHGITDVAILEKSYIGSGAAGRNTTIIRANYGIPEAIRFYQHSLELYQGLEAETGAEILHQTKGIFWVAHTEMAMRTERARAQMNTACGAQTVMVTPAELKELVPQVDLTGGGRQNIDFLLAKILDPSAAEHGDRRRATAAARRSARDRAAPTSPPPCRARRATARSRRLRSPHAPPDPRDPHRSRSPCGSR